MRLLAVMAATAGSAGALALAAVAAPVTPLPPISPKHTLCPKTVYTIEKYYGVQVVVAAQKGQHPSASLLTCESAYAITLAGKKYALKMPFPTGRKVTVGGATYTLGVGGPDVWPPASGPVYGWFGKGIEILLMIPSGR
jgi:hypothetical protein